jgi:hypothetical protein
MLIVNRFSSQDGTFVRSRVLVYRPRDGIDNRPASGHPPCRIGTVVAAVSGLQTVRIRAIAVKRAR